MDTLRELVVVAGLGVVASVLLSRWKVPLVAVLLLTGVIAGPAGLGLIHDLHRIELFAEVGVVFLLFSIGLEFSLERLAAIGRLVALGGSLQVGLTTALTALVLLPFGFTGAQGTFLGFAVALSSTAIVLRALAERGETDSPHGRFILGALIFQDLCVVPMMLLVPVLGGRGGGSPAIDAMLALGKAAAVVVATLTVARRVVPRVLDMVDRTRSREVFLLAVLVICLGTAWLTSLAGLSLALGAFMAGMVLAESDYAHRALGEVMPLRDALTSFFFISLGMLFDVRVVLAHPGTVFGVALAMLLAKGAVASAACVVMRFPPAVAVVAGAGLAQFGEFGFVLLKAGEPLGLISPAHSRMLLASAVLTMLVTPLMMSVAPRLAAGARRLRALERLLGAEPLPSPTASNPHILADHVVVVGFGVAGRTLAETLRRDGIEYVVLELNAETVRRARLAGEPVFYGDVAGAETLDHAHLTRARALVLLINDADATARAIVAARRIAPLVPVLARTPWVRDVARLERLGATEVVAAELAAGIALVERLYDRLEVAPTGRPSVVPTVPGIPA